MILRSESTPRGGIGSRPAIYSMPGSPVSILGMSGLPPTACKLVLPLIAQCRANAVGRNLPSGGTSVHPVEYRKSYERAARILPTATRQKNRPNSGGPAPSQNFSAAMGSIVAIRRSVTPPHHRSSQKTRWWTDLAACVPPLNAGLSPAGTLLRRWLENGRRVQHGCTSNGHLTSRPFASS